MEYKTSEIEVKLEDTVFLVKIVKGKRKNGFWNMHPYLRKKKIRFSLSDI